MVNYLQIPKAGDEIAYMGIDRTASDGTPYEAVKCFLTEESAEKYNGEKETGHPSKPGLSRRNSFWERTSQYYLSPTAMIGLNFYKKRIKERKIP